ncbi:class I SAM-dependent methyltransferase [Catalinimonas niigatensis]|uniref:class I SAM-dependent methyltransferase n=1 Tax=Catalinimonas niigatensis TaxID=1397264 RepID=UPI002666D325|nr:class I SAM-dependent methyltransferase [Catalinimonas niigatensis]WPP50753.1 class I SAM-dependent methyltransferase [Catalinimonas niigatensis]
MADKVDLDYTYSTLDQIFRLSIGETGDYSGAKYDGDFSMSLEEAQRAKHAFIADQLNIISGSNVLDMGCGWGPFVRYATEERGAHCIGLSLSEGQVKSCRQKGMEVYLKDCRTITPKDFGTFDAIVSLGAFEHFCSVEEYKAGQQETLYRRFFQTVYNLLPARGRFYLQTMVYDKNMMAYEDIDIHASKGSDAYIMALMLKQFPGSWLPYGSEMVIRNAEPLFKLIHISSGKRDYIETLQQWKKRFRSFQLKKYGLYLQKYMTDKEFRHKVAVFGIDANKICFEREIMDHYRMVFEKIEK